MLKTLDTKPHNITPPKVKNFKSKLNKEKYVLGDEGQEKSYLNSTTHKRAQHLSELFKNKTLFK
jgi:hypothetical protein